MFISKYQPFLIFIAGSVVFILILVSVIVFFVNQYQKRLKFYADDLKILTEAHKEELLKMELEIREQTLENVAIEIHDNIGQKLTLATINLNVIDCDDKTKAAEQVNGTLSILKKVMFDLRNMSRTMNSSIALKGGLMAALKTEVDQLNNSGVYYVELMTSGNMLPLEGRTELILFRIVQEALSNIMKHAQANQIEILMDYLEHELTLAIVDNGKGFDVTPESSTGCGLTNMTKRAEMLNGTLSIESSTQNGTKIIIKIPLNHESKIETDFS